MSGACDRPIIALFTDFGLNGPYVGQVHLAIRAIAPDVTVVDLMHDVPCFDVRCGAYLLAALAQRLPPGAITVCVVDPGVGGDRAPLMVNVDDRWYLGPDNGLFNILMRASGKASCRTINWRPERLSASFHGRDLFAPVAAKLALGESVSSSPCSALAPDWPDDLPQIIYIDGFGNAMTGIRATTLTDSARLCVGDQQLRHVRVFIDAEAGVPFWYANSLGLVEVAAREINVSECLAIAAGSPVVVRA